MTKDIVKKRVRDILDECLEANNHRKASERYAILDAAYGMGEHFSLDELDTALGKNNLRVSHATLYNTMRPFIELRLVVRHRLIGQTKYEACYNNEDHIRRICTLCGTVAGVDSPEIADAIKNTKSRRFCRDGFSLYIYGICLRCQATLPRQGNKFLTQKQVKNSYKSK